MKNFIKHIAICFCLLLSSTVLSQKEMAVKKNRANLATTYQVFKRANTQVELKPYKNARILVKTFKKANRFGMKIPVLKNRPLPFKSIHIDRIEEGPEWGWGWIHKEKTSARDIKGKKGKTNVHYFKNIRKKEWTTFSNDYDHVIVTDTLFAPAIFLNTDGKPRRAKRSYIKIIANCIIYETAIKPASTMLHNKTDYVFSADSIFFKTKHKGLQQMKVNVSPPFVLADVNIKLHKDHFSDDEKVLVNRLFIEIMRQISTELIDERNDWKKDKLLIEFQKYRYRVRTEVLYLDEKYKKFYDEFDDFDSNQENAIERKREVNDVKIMVEGKVRDLDKSPFKYYVIPSKATLVAMKDENTGVLNKLGDMLFRATGDTKRSITMEVKLGYKKELFDKANKDLNNLGFALEKNFPKKLLFVDSQPLKINGDVTGKIISIDSDILKLEIELKKDDLTLIELMAHNDVSFDIYYKYYDNREEHRQKTLFEVPVEITNQIDYEKMINEFNVIETNTLTDLIKITSNLKSDLGEEAEGKLNYIEVSLAFLFENEKKVFRGPFKMSSASVLGSENSELFTKYSENYSIKVTGTAYYENGEREIKDDLIITGSFIELEEGMFKTKED